MQTVDYSMNIYSMVDSISKGLRDVSEQELSRELEEEFDIGFYPLETNPESKFEKDTANEYLRAGFAISAMLAEEYDRPEDTFFEERSKDFREFEKELGEYGNSVLSDHLVQYTSLYGEIAEEGEIQLSHSLPEVALMNKSEKEEAVLEILGEMERSVAEIEGQVQDH